MEEGDQNVVAGTNLRCRGLLIGFCEGAAKDSGAGEDDLGDDTVRL